MTRDDAIENSVEKAYSAVIFPVLLTQDIADFKTIFNVVGLQSNDSDYPGEGGCFLFYNTLDTYGGLSPDYGYPWGNIKEVPDSYKMLPEYRCGESQGGYSLLFDFYDNEDLDWDYGIILHKAGSNTSLAKFSDSNFKLGYHYRCQLQVEEGYIYLNIYRDEDGTLLWSYSSNLTEFSIPLDKRYGAFAIAGATGSVDMDFLLCWIDFYLRKTAQSWDFEENVKAEVDSWIRLYATNGVYFGEWILKKEPNTVVDKIRIFNKGNYLKQWNGFYTDGEMTISYQECMLKDLAMMKVGTTSKH